MHVNAPFEAKGCVKKGWPRAQYGESADASRKTIGANFQKHSNSMIEDIVAKSRVLQP